MGYLVLFMWLGGLYVAFSQGEASQYYKGGYKYLESDIRKNLFVPPYVASRCIQGPVEVEFLIVPGKGVDSIIVKQSLCVDCDSAVVRAFRSLKPSKWIVDTITRTSYTVVIESHHSQCKNSDVYTAEGIKLYNKKEYKKAYEQFDLALRINPFKSDALFGRGMCSIMMGDKWGGCADLEEAARLGNKDAISMKSIYCK